MATYLIEIPHLENTFECKPVMLLKPFLSLAVEISLLKESSKDFSASLCCMSSLARVFFTRLSLAPPSAIVAISSGVLISTAIFHPIHKFCQILGNYLNGPCAIELNYFNFFFQFKYEWFRSFFVKV